MSMFFWMASTTCFLTSGGGSMPLNRLGAAMPTMPPAGHDVVAGAVALAHDAGQLGHGGRGHDVQHLGAVADDTAVLHLRTDHEAGHVHEEHQRQVEGVADLDEGG